MFNMFPFMQITFEEKWVKNHVQTVIN